MGVTAVLGILGALFWLGAVGGLGLAGLNVSRQRAARPGILIFIIGVIGGILLTTLNAGLVLVQPNQRAVVFQQIGGGETALRDVPLQPGLNWIIPFVQTPIIYDVGRREVTMAGAYPEPGQPSTTAPGELPAVRARSNDGQEVLVDVTVIYTIDPLKVNQVHVNWQNTFADAFIVPQTRSAVRDQVAQYSADEIYAGGRVSLQQDSIAVLTDKFEAEGFTMIDLLVRDVTFSEEFANAIEQKQIAEQEAQRAVFLVQQQEQEAERARVEAQGLADAEAIRADGDARATVTRAQAEAEALRLVNEQISQNPNLIQYRYIQELSDNVQLIIIPSNSPFLFDTQALLDQSGTAVTAPQPPSPPAEGSTQ